MTTQQDLGTASVVVTGTPSLGSPLLISGDLARFGQFTSVVLTTDGKTATTLTTNGITRVT